MSYDVTNINFFEKNSSIQIYLIKHCIEPDINADFIILSKTKIIKMKFI